MPLNLESKLAANSRETSTKVLDYLEDAAAYLKEQAEYLSKEAQKTIKRTKGQVEDVVDKVTDAAAGAVKSVSSLM